MGMDKKLWGGAIHIVIYILNRCPTKIMQDSTPYEVWFDKVLYTWGSLAPHAKCISLAGWEIHQVYLCLYFEKSKAHWCYDLVANKLYINQDVIFNECRAY